MSANLGFSVEEVSVWMEAQRACGHTIGFTCGAFDLFHAGHVQYLQKARALCDRLIVAVNSDASIQRYKSALRPINPLAHRQFVLSALSCVDAVTVLDEERPIGLIERWRPDFYIKGGDYQAEKLRSAQTVAAYGGQTVVIPLQYPTSTSLILDRIRALDAHALPEKLHQRPQPLVLLDRDGTLIYNVPYLHEPERVVIKPGVVEGLRQLSAAGYRLVVVTNQQGMGLGYFDMDALIAVNQRVLKEIGSSGVNISRIYFCPHAQGEGCHCRKPLPGMIERACRDFEANPAECVLIGDTEADEEAAAAAGVKSQIVNENEKNFTWAVDRILGKNS